MSIINQFELFQVASLRALQANESTESLLNGLHTIDWATASCLGHVLAATVWACAVRLQCEVWGMCANTILTGRVSAGQ